MRRPNSAQHEAARRLFALEARNAEGAGDGFAISGRVYDKLYGRLVPIVGAAGTRALFARSVKLASPDFHCLRRVDFEAEPTESVARRLTACLRAEAPAEVTEAGVAVCAALLALLAMLIGERLTLQLLRRTWPAFDAADEETK